MGADFEELRALRVEPSPTAAQVEALEGVRRRAVLRYIADREEEIAAAWSRFRELRQLGLGRPAATEIEREAFIAAARELLNGGRK